MDEFHIIKDVFENLRLDMVKIVVICLASVLRCYFSCGC